MVCMNRYDYLLHTSTWPVLTPILCSYTPCPLVPHFSQFMYSFVTQWFERLEMPKGLEKGKASNSILTVSHTIGVVV